MACGARPRRTTSCRWGARRGHPHQPRDTLLLLFRYPRGWDPARVQSPGRSCPPAVGPTTSPGALSPPGSAPGPSYVEGAHGRPLGRRAASRGSPRAPGMTPTGRTDHGCSPHRRPRLKSLRQHHDPERDLAADGRLGPSGTRGAWSSDRSGAVLVSLDDMSARFARHTPGRAAPDDGPAELVTHLDCKGKTARCRAALLEAPRAEPRLLWPFVSEELATGRVVAGDPPTCPTGHRFGPPSDGMVLAISSVQPCSCPGAEHHVPRTGTARPGCLDPWWREGLCTNDNRARWPMRTWAPETSDHRRLVPDGKRRPELVLSTAQPGEVVPVISGGPSDVESAVP